jgi:hypothetical protein
VALPRRDGSLTEPLAELLERSRAALRRYRHRRASACLRCGRTATTSCSACAARVCDRCWVLSIETGSAASLCLDCIAPGSSNCVSDARPRPSEVFQLGGRTLLGGLAAAAGVLFWQRGWAGPGVLMTTLLQPAVLLGLVPLAYLLGTLRVGLLRALRAIVSELLRSPSADRRPPS